MGVKINTSNTKLLYDISEVQSISRISMFIERHGVYYFLNIFK